MALSFRFFSISRSLKGSRSRFLSLSCFGRIVLSYLSILFAPDGTPRCRVRIRPESAKGGRSGDIFLPDALVPKLRKFWAHKRARGESLDAGAALFCSQSRVRISKRRVPFAWRQWQRKAGFDRLYSFHSIRHTSVSSVYRLSHDLFPRAAIREACEPAHDDHVHTSERPGDVGEGAGAEVLRC